MRTFLLVTTMALVWGCGDKDDVYTPDTSASMSEEGCWVTELDGEYSRQIDQVQDCSLCPTDWECDTYENLNNTKCFLPCREQSDCDECAPESTCQATTIGAEAQQVRICR